MTVMNSDGMVGMTMRKAKPLVVGSVRVLMMGMLLRRTVR
jgi:hypothetical protein